MGETMKARNVRWSDHTEDQLLAIQDYFSPLGRSETLRHVIAIFYVALSTPEILHPLHLAFQRKHCKTLLHAVRTAQEAQEIA